MPVTKNTMLRLATIDRCLRNRFRKWTIQDLMDACSDALYEYEGREEEISLRTIRSDIALMRSDKLGYNAPIVVTDRKFYAYDDPDYSITQFPLHKEDINILSGAIDIIHHYQAFTQFKGAEDVISRLQDHINTTVAHEQPIIYLDTNQQLRGLDKISVLYNLISEKKVAKITYKSFKSLSRHTLSASCYILKEFNNRWFVLCSIKGERGIFNLALDRIEEISEDEKAKFIENTFFNPQTYYDDIIGVTKFNGDKVQHIVLQVDADQAPYILTKPLHKSQKLEEGNENGIIISLNVIHNLELERIILSYGEHIKVLAPRLLKHNILKKLKQAYENY